MKKKSLKGIFASIMILMLVVVSACSSGTSKESNSDSGTSKSDVKPIEFSMGHPNSPEHIQDKNVKRPFAEEVEKLTEGRVTFKIYPGGALGGPKEIYDNTTTGIMDSGWSLAGTYPGKFPAHSVLQLPFLANGTATELSIAAQKIYDTFPEVQKDYADVKVLWFGAMDPYCIITKGKAVRSFADVKGLKLRTPSLEAGEMIKSWGATPVSLPAPEIFDAMQKGVIDGGVLPVTAIKDFNLFDIVDYVTYGNFNTSLNFAVMNKDSWNKMSPEDQKLIEENLIGEPMAQKAGEGYDYQLELAMKESEEAGIEFITLPEAELQMFKDKSVVVKEKWLADMEAKGIDGQKIYDEAVKLIGE